MIATLRESKAKLSALVARAAGGEEVVITVRGKPRARLCPVALGEPDTARERKQWGQRLRETRATYATHAHASGAILDALREDRS